MARACVFFMYCQSYGRTVGVRQVLNCFKFLIIGLFAGFFVGVLLRKMG